jgi:hypothetical protein
VYNHFNCGQFPAHSHWSLGGAAGDELTIDWASYGTYVLRVDGVARSGEGSLVGSPSDWRKMAFVAFLQVKPNPALGQRLKCTFFFAARMQTPAVSIPFAAAGGVCLHAAGGGGRGLRARP